MVPSCYIGALLDASIVLELGYWREVCALAAVGHHLEDALLVQPGGGGRRGQAPVSGSRAGAFAVFISQLTLDPFGPLSLMLLHGLILLSLAFLAEPGFGAGSA